MKQVLFFVLVLLGSTTMSAQLKTPARSPKAKIEQQVGLTDIAVEYSRPSMRGRTIFGDLVPYDKMWRTGANKNTMVTFSTDVMISGQEVPAGSYAIFTKPGAEMWEVMLYNDTENWGVPDSWSDDKVAAKVMAKPMTIPGKVETFMITFDEVTSSRAQLGMMWDNIYVGMDIDVPTDKAVEANIERVMNGPSARDYYSAAVYYLNEGKDINQARMWVDKAIMMTSEDPKFWMLRQQSLIHAKAGSKDSAIAAAKKSLELAEKAGNMGYVKMNKASLKEWGAM